MYVLVLLRCIASLFQLKNSFYHAKHWRGGLWSFRFFRAITDSTSRTLFHRTVSVTGATLKERGSELPEKKEGRIHLAIYYYDTAQLSPQRLPDELVGEAQISTPRSIHMWHQEISTCTLRRSAPSVSSDPQNRRPRSTIRPVPFPTVTAVWTNQRHTPRRADDSYLHSAPRRHHSLPPGPRYHPVRPKLRLTRRVPYPPAGPTTRTRKATLDSAWLSSTRLS